MKRHGTATGPADRSETKTSAPSRLQRLLGFLKSDPGNVRLASDTARQAYDDKDFATAKSIIEDMERGGQLTPDLTGLKGCIALAEGRYGDAQVIFENLVASTPEDTVARFNLAWAKFGLRNFEAVLSLLDDRAMAVSPEAPVLKIQSLHHLQRYEDALREGETLAQRFPGNQALMGALASLSLDAERIDLARFYAERAGAAPDGRAALGILALGDHDIKRSLMLFDDALAKQASNPRAWIGKGLALLQQGDVAEGAQALDRGAELFGTHLGSWVAAGWAHYVAADLQSARVRFERAIAVDDTFAESHGGLAVIDIAEDKFEDARRRTEVALRLDRRSFGGALARSLLLEHDGRGDAARKVRAFAYATPVGINGRTLGEEIAVLGAARPAKNNGSPHR